MNIVKELIVEKKSLFEVVREQTRFGGSKIGLNQRQATVVSINFYQIIVRFLFAFILNFTNSVKLLPLIAFHLV